MLKLAARVKHSENERGRVKISEVKWHTVRVFREYNLDDIWLSTHYAI
jgi:hypothetical protein